jgi:PEP-CTERM motif-containing protein
VSIAFGGRVLKLTPPDTHFNIVPEPSSRMLLSLAAVGGKLARRRRTTQYVSRTHWRVTLVNKPPFRNGSEGGHLARSNNSRTSSDSIPRSQGCRGN